MCLSCLITVCVFYLPPQNQLKGLLIGAGFPEGAFVCGTLLIEAKKKKKLHLNKLFWTLKDTLPLSVEYR